MLWANLICMALLLLGQHRPKDDTGLPVDGSGFLADDPTRNVLSLVDAAVKRHDDLRLADLRYLELVIKRSDDLRMFESTRVSELLSMRADYEERLTLAEAKRIDAIRAVDVNAVAVASQRASDQATVLATQVTQTAETLRALVATTASTNNQAQTSANATLSDRITALEQKQYVGQGRQAYTDPQMIAMVDKLDVLARAQTASAGKSEGYGNLWVWVVAGASVFFGVLPYLKNMLRDHDRSEVASVYKRR